MTFLSRADLMFYIATKKIHLIVDRDVLNAKIESYTQFVENIIAIAKLER